MVAGRENIERGRVIRPEGVIETGTELLRGKGPGAGGAIERGSVGLEGRADGGVQSWRRFQGEEGVQSWRRVRAGGVIRKERGERLKGDGSL